MAQCILHIKIMHKMHRKYLKYEDRKGGAFVMKKKVKSISDNEGIRFRFPMKTEIDIDLLNILASGHYPYFLKCSYRSEDAEHIITFDTRSSYSLKNYIDHKFDNFVFFLSECFLIIGECKLANIPLCNILFDSDTSFVRNGHLQLVVLPLVSKVRFNAKKFYSKIIRSYFLPSEMKARLLNAVKIAQNENDALKLIDAELRKSQAKPGLPVNFSHAKRKADNDETACISEEETTYLNVDDECETTFLDVES